MQHQKQARNNLERLDHEGIAKYFYLALAMASIGMMIYIPMWVSWQIEPKSIIEDMNPIERHFYNNRLHWKTLCILSASIVCTVFAVANSRKQK